jgi:hypothetical protein
MQNVIIVDVRPEWVKLEDRVMACLTRCFLYKYCSSRHGMNCKQFGGSEIPKLRG